MDYQNIKLENERSTHLTKRLNRLSSWSFFKVLYRETMGRMLLTNLLLVLCFVPIIVIVLLYASAVAEYQYMLPLMNTLGVGQNAWVASTQLFEIQKTALFDEYLLWSVLGFLAFSVMLSGGFAVVRDAFWTGKIRVFAPFADGLRSNFFYALVSTGLIGLMVYRVIRFYIEMSLLIPLWLAIVLTVQISMVFAFAVMYLLILCSVTVTYSQSFVQNLKDSWLLLWMNVLPNIFRLIVMAIPVVAYFVLSALISFVLVFMLMVGAFYFAFVWQTHMMKTFALFHPVESKKQ